MTEETHCHSSCNADHTQQSAPVAKKAAAQPAPAVPARALDDPSRLRVVVGRLVKVWPHPDSEKLWCEMIDIGEAEPRQIASGIRHFYPTEAHLLNKLVLVLANLKPRKLAGFESQGMILCAVTESGCELIEPPAGSAVGERVLLGGVAGDFDATLNPKKNPWEQIAPELKTRLVDGERPAAFYKDSPFETSAGRCECASLVGANVQ